MENNSINQLIPESDHSLKIDSSGLFILLNIITVAIIAILLSYILWQGHASRIQETKNSMRFAADLYAAQTHENILAIEKMLSSIDHNMQLSSRNDTNLSHSAINNYLINIQSDYQYLMDILIIDDQGIIKHWTGPGSPPNVTASAYTQHHINSLDSTLLVGEPLQSKHNKGRWFFSISLPIRGSLGELKSIIVAIIDIDHFRQQLTERDLPTDSTLVLIKSSGKVITRFPDHNNYVASQVQLPANLLDINNNGSFELFSPFDQIDRIAGFSPIKEYGLLAFASMPKQVILKQWYFYLVLSGLLFLTIVIVLGLSTMQLIRSQNRMTAQRKQLFLLANTDELTGLINRRRLHHLITNEIKRAKRYQRDLSFIMMDIDHFKNVNDQYGHQFGDHAIRHIAKIIHTSCREEDVPARYGGEEFLIMLPETSLKKAAELAERLRASIENSVLEHKAISIKLTTSFGVADYLASDEYDSADCVIKFADNALYQAKNSGRNRVCIANVDTTA